MGAQVLAELCRQLEVRAQHGRLLGVEDLIESIEQEFITVRRLYGQERQKFPISVR
ncbi:hypothetical protein D3C85_1016260 [compost metagenome]